jgi:hypothetical protein
MDEQSLESESLSEKDLEPGTLEHPKEFGIFDTKYKTWVGTTDSPITYDKFVVAQISAQIMSERLGMPLGQLMAERFTGANKKGEDLQTARSFEDAFKRVVGEE